MAVQRDPQQIVSELFDAYCDHIDQRNLEPLARVFTPDCQVSFGGVAIDGFPALLDFLRTGLARFDATRHVVSDSLVDEISPERFRCVSRIRAWHRFVGNRPDLTIVGHYRNVFVSTDEGWRIAEHRGSEQSRTTGEPSLESS
ncbi:nuclear transport factor 2 family protein [Myxococcota bacterium]|nr:nuclear transport factor 2 family protein [Myxococcota bacterium]